jgi:hypothetical protein
VFWWHIGYESGFGRWAGSMQGADRTVRGRRETLPCLLTFSSGSNGDESGRSRRRTGERAGSFELRRCMMVVAASRGRRFVTDGKLKQEIYDHRLKNSLCLYCGEAGHRRPECPRRKLAQKADAFARYVRKQTEGWY